MSKIDNIDIGTVTLIEKIGTGKFQDLEVNEAASGYSQNLNTQKQEWRIEGLLIDPTQTSIENLENIRNHGLMCFIDLEDVNPLILGYGKLTEFRLLDEEAYAAIARYEAIIRLQSAIGLTFSNTYLAYLHDLMYRSKVKAFDPQLGRFDKTWSANRLEFMYEFYVDNYKDTAQTVILEIQCGDDLHKMELWGWKNSAWSLIGTWGTGGTPWGGAVGQWFDQDGAGHIALVDKGVRGETLGAGTLSLKLGCNKRILLKMTNMQSFVLLNFAVKQYETSAIIHDLRPN